MAVKKHAIKLRFMSSINNHYHNSYTINKLNESSTEHILQGYALLAAIPLKDGSSVCLIG